MITESYCSFEVSQLLKEKGFDKRSYGAYNLQEEFQEGYGEWNKTSIYYAAPTHQMAMKWLRGKGFHINASISYDYSEDADGNIVDKWTFWFFEIYSSFGGNIIYTEEVNEYNSYEEAVEAALLFALKNLI